MTPPSNSDLSLTGPVDVGGRQPARIVVHARRILCIAICGAVFMKFALVSRLPASWDEFYFLELVHQYARGELAIRFQTFHVHLFSWLPSLGWDVVDQIVAARVVMAALATGSAAMVYGIARRFVCARSALFAVLAYLSVTAVIQHGASFRVDPIVTFLLLLSLFGVLCRPGGVQGAILAGAAMALAILVTIKSALYLIVIAGVFWSMAPTLRARATLAAGFGGSFLLCAGALHLLHSSLLAELPAEGARDFLQGAASKVFLDEVFPRAFDLIQMVLANPLLWIMMMEGAVVAWAAARARNARSGWLPLLPLVLALPVLTPIFYRNAFDYFYPLILAPAVVLVGISFEKHLKAAPRPGGLPIVAVLIVAQCAMLLFNAVTRIADHVSVQRETVAAVRSIFPQPVPYIEGFGVLADYPRVGFFMSSWGVENYRRAGQPVLSTLVARHQPVFVLADSPSLYAALAPGVEVDPDRAFLPEDTRFLRENYIHHWGMVFVAGKHLRSAEAAAGFDVAIAGAYRLEAESPLFIDGNSVAPGDSIALSAGAHRVDFGGSAEATLRWAQASTVPALPPTDPLTFFQRNSWAGMTPAMMRADAR